MTYHGDDRLYYKFSSFLILLAEMGLHIDEMIFSCPIDGRLLCPARILMSFHIYI